MDKKANRVGIFFAGNRLKRIITIQALAAMTTFLFSVRRQIYICVPALGII
jgi:hypothetical protein